MFAKVEASLENVGGMHQPIAWLLVCHLGHLEQRHLENTQAFEGDPGSQCLERRQKVWRLGPCCQGGGIGTGAIL